MAHPARPSVSQTKNPDGVLVVVLWVAVLFIQNPPVNEKCPVTVHHRAVSV